MVEKDKRDKGGINLKFIDAHRYSVQRKKREEDQQHKIYIKFYKNSQDKKHQQVRKNLVSGEIIIGYVLKI